jgi:hypothetical protein
MGLAQIPLPDAMVCTWHLPEYVMVFMWPFLPLFSKAPCALDLLGVPDLKPYSKSMCPLCKLEKYYVLPGPGHCALFLPRFHKGALAGTMGYTQLISVICINYQPHEISFNICEYPSGLSHVREVLCNLLTRNTDCWFNFTGINAGPSVVLCSCAVVLQSKTYVLL